MVNKRRGMLLGSLVGDAFALGPHWIYDVDEIKRKFGRITEISEPPKGSYHTNKRKGDFTHYGDQTMMLMNYLINEKNYNQEKFRNYWLKEMEGFTGYRDHATKETIAILQDKNALNGSSSKELGGASRMAPLVYRYSDDWDTLAKYIKEETSLTHADPVLLSISEVLGEIAFRALKGESPTSAIESIRLDAHPEVVEMIDKAMERIEDTPQNVILDFGQSCGSASAFPVVIYLLEKYPNNFTEALIQNVMGGGDSAARGMVLGMILGAYLGEKAIPKTWLEAMNAYPQILDWM